MNRIRVILLAVPLMLFITACNKDRPVITGNQDIRFGMHISDGYGSKALLEPSDLQTNGNEIKVYGFADNDITGHKSDGTEGTSKLNDGQILQYGENGWKFVRNGDESYKWLYGETHKFFGWLSHDNESNISADSFFGDGFSFSAATKILNIPERELPLNENILDFAYSDIVTRDAASADYSAVDLPLHHLFAAFSLSARNYSSKPVTIESIYFHGLTDIKSATIDYSGNSAVTTYAGGTALLWYLYSDLPGLTLSKAGTSGDTKANVVGTPGDSPVYFLVWPQTKEELEFVGTDDIFNPYLEITYSQDGERITAKVGIPHDTDDPDGWGWGPGVRHEMELSFQDKEIDLGLKAAGWDKLEPVIDYNGAVSVKEKLQLAPEFYNNCILSATGDTAYFKPGIPIVLQFSIGTPENATWIVGKKLDFDSFDVYNYPDGARKSPDDDVKAEGLVDGNSVRIAIDPPRGTLSKNEYYLRLSFTVRLNNGDTVNLNDDNIYADGCPRTFIYIKQ